MICFDDSFRIIDQDFEKVVFVGDLHIPFHDRRLLELLFAFLDWFRPHRIFILGDLIDCYTLSDFLKDLRRITTLQEELDEANRVLSELYRLCPEIEFFEGNHEYRL